MWTFIQNCVEIKNFAFGPQPTLPKVTVDQNAQTSNEKFSIWLKKNEKVERRTNGDRTGC